MSNFGHRVHRLRPLLTRGRRLHAGDRRPVTRLHPGAPDDDRTGSPADLRLVASRLPGVVVLSAAGVIDLSTAPSLDSALAEAIAARPRLIVVDLTETDFLSCAGLSSLVNAQHLVGEQVRLTVVAPTRVTQRPIHLTGVDEFLTVCSTVTDALSGPSAG